MSRPGLHEPVEHPGRVVVLGATEDDAPPGLSMLDGVIDVAFADDAEGLADRLPGSDVVFAWRPRGEPLEAAWTHAGDLRWIQSASAGVDRLLFPALVESHVVVTNARGIFDDAIAEYVVGLILFFAKGFHGVLERQRRREWSHRETEMAQGKRVLIVGVGSIGRAIGRRCLDLGMLVRGVGSSARAGDDVFRVIHGVDELAAAAGWAEIVVDVLPGTASTRHVFDEAVIGAMPMTARFINVGRGSTVDQAALTQALREGRLAGAALDVFEDEPLPEDDPLWDLPNVVVSPHMSGDFAGFPEALVELFVDNLRRYLTGEPLRNVVDKTRGYVPS